VNIHESEEKIYSNQAYTAQLMVELQEKSLVFSMFISIFGGIVGMLISKKCVEILHYELDNPQNISIFELLALLIIPFNKNTNVLKQ